MSSAAKIKELRPDQSGLFCFMDIQTKQQITDYLIEFISEERLSRIDEVLSARTQHITVVLEDLYQPHNASAVLRSCDGFGVQDVHIIENRNQFDATKGVTIGADQWLSLSKYSKEGENNTKACFDKLRGQGYKIVATTPHENDKTIDELDITQKTALVFGAELEGLSKLALDEADEYVKIPMFGFSESFNISVSAALCLYEVTKRLRGSDLEWKLDSELKKKLRYEWIKQSIKAGKELEARFLKESGLS